MFWEIDAAIQQGCIVTLFLPFRIIESDSILQNMPDVCNMKKKKKMAAV
jgi:hypothetical protein